MWRPDTPNLVQRRFEVFMHFIVILPAFKLFWQCKIFMISKWPCFMLDFVGFHCFSPFCLGSGLAAWPRRSRCWRPTRPSIWWATWARAADRVGPDSSMISESASRPRSPCTRRWSLGPASGWTRRTACTPWSRRKIEPPSCLQDDRKVQVPKLL